MWSDDWSFRQSAISAASPERTAKEKKRHRHHEGGEDREEQQGRFRAHESECVLKDVAVIERRCRDAKGCERNAKGCERCAKGDAKGDIWHLSHDLSRGHNFGKGGHLGETK